MKTISKRGFTIIELLVVIFIIVLLTGILLPSLLSSRVKSRDAKRVSDMAQIQLALNLYYDKCKQYPTQLVGASTYSVDINATNCTGGASGNLADYISKIPTPPSSSLNQSVYDYSLLKDANNIPIGYVLHIQLEGTNEVIKDGLSAMPTPPTGLSYTPNLTCDQTTNYCLGPK